MAVMYLALPTLLDALKEAKILVEKAEVKKKEISVTYLKEEVLE